MATDKSILLTIVKNTIPATGKTITRHKHMKTYNLLTTYVPPFLV